MKRDGPGRLPRKFLAVTGLIRFCLLPAFAPGSAAKFLF